MSEVKTVAVPGCTCYLCLVGCAEREAQKASADPATPKPDRATTTTTTATTVLEEADRIVNGNRRNDYGNPDENHRRTAALWSAYLGIDITARQVCMLNVLQKVSRDRHAANRDNLVDIAGYAENANLIKEPKS